MNFKALKWDEKGLITAIYQDIDSGEVLTLAYTNREALEKSLKTGFAHVYRRSKQKVMMKGETSGRRQEIREILLDCDGDAIIFKIKQHGDAACHKGYRSCFFRRLTDGEWEIVGTPLFDPEEVYGKKNNT